MKTVNNLLIRGWLIVLEIPKNSARPGETKSVAIFSNVCRRKPGWREGLRELA